MEAIKNLSTPTFENQPIRKYLPDDTLNIILRFRRHFIICDFMQKRGTNKYLKNGDSLKIDDKEIDKLFQLKNVDEVEDFIPRNLITRSIFGNVEKVFVDCFQYQDFKILFLNINDDSVFFYSTSFFPLEFRQREFLKSKYCGNYKLKFGNYKG